MNATRVLGYINIIGTIANMVVLVIFLIWLPAASINQPKYLLPFELKKKTKLTNLGSTIITRSG